MIMSSSLSDKIKQAKKDIVDITHDSPFHIAYRCDIHNGCEVIIKDDDGERLDGWFSEDPLDLIMLGKGALASAIAIERLRYSLSRNRAPTIFCLRSEAMAYIECDDVYFDELIANDSLSVDQISENMDDTVSLFRWAEIKRAKRNLEGADEDEEVQEVPQSPLKKLAKPKKNKEEEAKLFKHDLAVKEKAVLKDLKNLLPTTMVSSQKICYAASQITLEEIMIDFAFTEFSDDFSGRDLTVIESYIIWKLRGAAKCHISDLPDGFMAKMTKDALETLKCDGAIKCRGDYIKLSEKMKPRPKVVTIKLGFLDWEEALIEATQHRKFSMEAYVALPKNIAEDIKKDKLKRQQFNQSGVGLLGISGGTITIFQPAAVSENLNFHYDYVLSRLKTSP
jgi:hypothetical protein